MVAYKKTYIDFFGYVQQDFIPCENCGSGAVDVHHITFKSQGGGNNIENLIGVCRSCHNKAHNSKEFNEKLRKIHLDNINKKI